MFKKLSVVLLCFAFLFGVFAGCDQDSPDPKPSDKKEITVQIDGESEGRLERVYDGEPQTVTANSTPAKTLKIEYEGKDGTQYEKTQTAPTDAGSYAVTVSFAGDSEYKAYSKTVQLNVAKADPIIDAEGSSAGKISAGYTGSPVAVEPVVIPDDIEVTIEYKDKDAEDEEYTQTAPTDVVVYTVKISFDGNVNFSAAEELFELEITQGEVVLSLEGLVSGAVRKDYTGEPVAVEPIVTPSEKTVSVEYKAKGESDSEYTSQAPAAVGEYDVRLLFAGDKNYKAKTEVFTLVISYKAAEIPAGAETISDFSDNKFQVFEKDDPRGGNGATIADHWTMENGEFVYDNTAGGAIDLRDGEVAFADWFESGSILPADHNYTTLYVAVRVEGEGTLDIQLDTYHENESSFKYAVNDVAAAETEGWKIVEVPIAPENHISESQREIDTKIVRIIASEGISAVHLDWIAAKQTKVRISLVGEADGVVTVPFTGNAIAVTPVTSPADKPVTVEYKPQGAEDAHGRYQLDFSVPEVRAYADGVVDRLVSEYGVGYIKNDYNINCGKGSNQYCVSCGDGLLKHNRGFVSWLEGVYRRHPHLVIENCASGGLRMDYVNLALDSIQSTSDQTDYRKYAAISANCASAVTPEQAAVWSYPLKSGDVEETAFNMVNAMLFRIHQSGNIAQLSAERFALVKEGIEVYKKIRGDIGRGFPVFLTDFAYYDAPFLAYALKTENKFYIALWNLDSKKTVSVRLPKKVKNCEVLYPAKMRTKFGVQGDVLTFEPENRFCARLFIAEY